MKRLFAITLVLCLVLTGMIIFVENSSVADLLNETSLSYRAKIQITSDTQFTAANGVVSGAGTVSDPYIIENHTINATFSEGIYIKDTTKLCYCITWYFRSSIGRK